MVAQTSRKHLILPVAPMIGVVLGLGAALAVLLVPVAAIEDLMLASGLPQILPVAAPPLGVTARLGLMLAAAGGAGLGTWFLLFLAIGTRSVTIGQPQAVNDDPMVPVLRRADAHPDAPARRPLFANEDLGTPFLEVRAPRQPAEIGDVIDETDPIIRILTKLSNPGETGSFTMPTNVALDVLVPQSPSEEPRSIPIDLDVPLAAYDPDAILAEPLTPTPSVKPLAVAAACLPESDAEGQAVPEPLMPGEPPSLVEPLPIEAIHHDEPLEPLEPLAIASPDARLEHSRSWVLEPGERLETFELTPMVRREPCAAPTPRDPGRMSIETEATITSLLERLERSVSEREARRACQPAAAARSINDALGELRALATRAN